MLRVLGSCRQLAGGLFGGLFLQRLLTGGAQQMQLRLLLGQYFQQGIHVPLVLEVALLLLAAVVLHHKIRHGANTPLPEKPPELIATRLNTRVMLP